MMKRALLLAGLGLVLWFAGKAVVHWLASDETKIRWRIEDAVDAFNDTKTAGCLEPIAADWTHESSGIDRETLKGYVIKVFFEARHPTTKEFVYRAELDEASLAIEATDGGQATASAEFTFWRLDADPPRPEWGVRVAGELACDERGWLFASTRHETLEGDRL